MNETYQRGTASTSLTLKPVRRREISDVVFGPVVEDEDREGRVVHGLDVLPGVVEQRDVLVADGQEHVDRRQVRHLLRSLKDRVVLVRLEVPPPHCHREICAHDRYASRKHRGDTFSAFILRTPMH